MKSFLFTIACIGSVTTTQAFSWDDVTEFVGTIPRTRKERLASMDADLLRGTHTAADKVAIKARAHKHTLRATAHREILGEKMGLPKRTPYYELMQQGHHHSLLAAGEDD
jgi:hypothetical protein